MAKIYYRKITNKETNPATDKEWTIGMFQRGGERKFNLFVG